MVQGGQALEAMALCVLAQVFLWLGFSTHSPLVSQATHYASVLCVSHRVHSHLVFHIVCALPI